MIKVAAAILVKDGRILIAKRLPSDKLANKWEFPGGKLKPGKILKNVFAAKCKKSFRLRFRWKGFSVIVDIAMNMQIYI